MQFLASSPFINCVYSYTFYSKIPSRLTYSSVNRCLKASQNCALPLSDKVTV